MLQKFVYLVSLVLPLHLLFDNKKNDIMNKSDILKILMKGPKVRTSGHRPERLKNFYENACNFSRKKYGQVFTVAACERAAQENGFSHVCEIYLGLSDAEVNQIFNEII